MKSIASTILFIYLLCTASISIAQERQYKPGGAKWAATWAKFYSGDHEPELDDPLIEAGKGMTLVICEAVKMKDMALRRYAIGALGFIGDEGALPTLEGILKSKDEIYYFRGDALHSIYLINKDLGKKYAKKFGNEHEYLKRLEDNINKDAKWLTEPTEE